ncbi:MAG: Hsp20/alpha crystallin family protein [Eubacteriales bacterium]|jgi:HSP20 family protein
MFELMPFGHGEKSLFNYFDNFEKNFFGGSESALAHFRTDILDKGDHYQLQAELPGFQKEDIHIDLEGDYLTISAVHNEENKEEKDGHYIRRERRYGSFQRSFDVTGIQVDAIKAAYDNGILTLDLPKAAEPQPKKQQIQID